MGTRGAGGTDGPPADPDEDAPGRRSSRTPAGGLPAPGPVLTAVLIGVLCLIWGSTWFAIKVGLADLPPLFSAGVRFALAAAVFAALAPRLRRFEGGAPPSGRLTAIITLSNFSISYVIVYQCETVLPSGLTSVLWATYPIFIAAAGSIVLPEERLAPVQWGGFIVGFIGVAVLTQVDLRALGPEVVTAGLLLLLSPLTVAAGTVFIKREGAHVSSVLLNRNGIFFGALGLLSLSLLLERGRPVALTSRAVLATVYLALFGSVLAFGLYFWLLRFARATTLALISYITPIIALGIGVVAGGEPLRPATLAGTGLIVAGIVLTGRKRRRRPAAPTAAALPVVPDARRT